MACLDCDRPAVVGAAVHAPVAALSEQLAQLQPGQQRFQLSAPALLDQAPDTFPLQRWLLMPTRAGMAHKLLAEPTFARTSLHLPIAGARVGTETVIQAGRSAHPGNTGSSMEGSLEMELRWLLQALLRCDSIVVADVRAGAHCSSAQYKRSPHAPAASGGHGVPGRSSLQHVIQCSGRTTCHCMAAGHSGALEPVRQQARHERCIQKSHERLQKFMGN